MLGRVVLRLFELTGQTVAFELRICRHADVREGARVRHIPSITRNLITHNIAMVGLPDKAVSEAKERVRAALVASGLALPARRITVNLAPADLPKEGR